ncbi:MAG: hypothetical protein D6808_01850 [Candidatus Dadabacteria bacterium]|nr:MAG: hypothetical protein D6808_01850 [Candidatus Dadabacteria bacterium]
MYLLGISCYYHDASACLIRDGEVIAAAEEERFSRIKHDHRFPANAINFCLEFEQINAADLDYVVFYEKPAIKLDRVIGTLAKRYPRSKDIFWRVMENWGREKLWIAETIKKRLQIPKNKILFSEHHLSHAANAFYLSPFEEAAVLTVDGVGEWITTTFGRAKNTTFSRFGFTNFPNSLGLLYSAFTEFLGFEVNEGEYKVMGMAPYGKPKYKDKVSKLFSYLTYSGFELDMSYFAYEYSSRTNLTGKFLDLWGEPRKKDEPFFIPRYAKDLGDDESQYSAEVIKRSQYYADVAASIQEFTEDIIVNFARYLKKETGSDNLCFAGGVANNSVANGRLIRESGFKNIYVPPGPGDSGAAIGAALAAYYTVAERKTPTPLRHAYLGKEYSEDQARKAFIGAGYTPQECSSDDELLSITADLLTSGKVVGWHQGRFEFGPRALGARSILADPRSATMKKIVNARVKFRELFRPFAPSCLEEYATEYYDMEAEQKEQYPYRFMQGVVPVREKYQGQLQATTHVDGTARLQVVYGDVDINPLFHSLIDSFGARTGIYALLNTSFNRRGEPIVASPEDALTTFEWCKIDALVCGPFVIKRAD